MKADVKSYRRVARVLSVNIADAQITQVHRNIEAKLWEVTQKAKAELTAYIKDMRYNATVDVEKQ